MLFEKPFLPRDGDWRADRAGVVCVCVFDCQDYLKDTKACLTNDFSRYKRALTSVRQDLPDADSLGQVGGTAYGIFSRVDTNVFVLLRVTWLS